MKGLGAAITVLLAGWVQAGPAQLTRPALDSLLSFSNAKRCQQTHGHRQFLSAMAVKDGNFHIRLGKIRVPASLRPAFGPIRLQRTKEWTRISVPVRGTLFGLPLVEIEQNFPAGGDPPMVSYSFDAPTEVVEREAKRHGFPVRAGQNVPLGSDGVYDLSVYLGHDAHHAGWSTLACGIG